MSDKVLVSPEDLAALMRRDKVVLIDTRDPGAYAEAHIPGAVNIRDVFTFLAASTPQGIEQMRVKFAEAFGRAGLSGAETAVVYEQSMESGFGQSCRGYILLRHLGYPKALVLHGGYDAWRAVGMPSEAEAPEPQAAAFPTAKGDPILVGVNDMKAALADERIVKLDVRDVDEWIAESSSPYGKDFAPRKGRIPGAKWIEWYRLMKPTPQGQRFKTRTEILADCETVGIAEETPVIIYCFKGARASNTFVALKEAGIKDVKVYFGSWNEWSRDPSLPIETGPPFKRAP